MSFSNFLNEGVHDTGKFKAIIMAGGPASGKSYQIDRISSASGIIPKVVNIDHAVEHFMRRGSFNDSEHDYDTAMRITSARLLMYISAGLPLIIDSTSANFRVTVHRTQLLINLGYDVGMVYIKADIDAAKKRNQMRFRKVPDSIIDDYHNSVDIHYQAYKRMFNSTFFTTIKVDEMDDSSISMICRKAGKFFSDPLNNDIGLRMIDTVKRGNYYQPSSISSSVSRWFSAD